MRAGGRKQAGRRTCQQWRGREQEGVTEKCPTINKPPVDLICAPLEENQIPVGTVAGALDTEARDYEKLQSDDFAKAKACGQAATSVALYCPTLPLVTDRRLCSRVYSAGLAVLFVVQDATFKANKSAMLRSHGTV